MIIKRLLFIDHKIRNCDSKSFNIQIFNDQNCFQQCGENCENQKIIKNHLENNFVRFERPWDWRPSLGRPLGLYWPEFFVLQRRRLSRRWRRRIRGETQARSKCSRPGKKEKIKWNEARIYQVFLNFLRVRQGFLKCSRPGKEKEEKQIRLVFLNYEKLLDTDVIALGRRKIIN